MTNRLFSKQHNNQIKSKLQSESHEDLRIDSACITNKQWCCVSLSMLLLSSVSQEHRCPGLRDADGDLAVPGGREAGDLPQHLSDQHQLHRGGAAASGPSRHPLHQEPAHQRARVRDSQHMHYITKHCRALHSSRRITCMTVSVQRCSTLIIIRYVSCTSKSAYVSLEHKPSHIWSNSQQYIVWVKIMHFIFKPKIIRLCSMKIFSRFPIINILKYA